MKRDLTTEALRTLEKPLTVSVQETGDFGVLVDRGVM